MIESLNNLDTQLFLWINHHHCQAMDWVMWVSSQHWCWAVVLVLFFVFGTLQREPRKFWWVPLGIVLCFLMADRGSVVLFKETFHRLRPCMALQGVEEVYMFRTHCGSPYGFVSSHAANAFAIVSFLWLRYRRWQGHTSKRAMVLPLLALAWAIITCYSRVYLGKHYPGDILGGALFGMVCGTISWVVIELLEKKLLPLVTKK